MPTQQNFKNHTRYDPLFHYVIFPLLFINFVFSIYATIHNWPNARHLNAWWIVMSIVVLLLAIRSRSTALKTQDRIIRLEERLRLTALLPPAEHDNIRRLTVPQLVALRFASDEELPSLFRKALTDNLSPKDIKKAIDNWRPDHHRV